MDGVPLRSLLSRTRGAWGLTIFVLFGSKVLSRGESGSRSCSDGLGEGIGGDPLLVVVSICGLCRLAIQLGLGVGE